MKAGTPVLMCSVPGYDASGRVDDLAAQLNKQITSVAIGTNLCVLHPIPTSQIFFLWLFLTFKRKQKSCINYFATAIHWRTSWNEMIILLYKLKAIWVNLSINENHNYICILTTGLLGSSWEWKSVRPYNFGCISVGFKYDRNIHQFHWRVLD